MKIRKHTFFLKALLIFSVCVNAQTPKVATKWESSFNKNIQEKTVYYDYLGGNEKSYFILTRKLSQNPNKYVYGIEKYDKESLRPTDSKPLEEIGAISQIYRIENETYALIDEKPSRYSTKNDKYGFYKFDKDKMVFEPITEQFASVDFKNFKDLYSSPDKSKILFVFKKESEDKKEKDLYQFLLTDIRFDKLWEKTVTLPYIKDFAVGNDATAYAAFIDNHGKKKDRTGYEYVLAKISNDNEKRFTVNMNDYLYNDCRILTNNANKLLAVGYYSDKVNNEKTGSYFFSMNEVFDKAENISYQEIPVKLLSLNHSKKKPYERYEDYEFGKPLYGENGEIAICAEENTCRTNKTTEYTYWNPGAISPSTSADPHSTIASQHTTSSARNFYYDIYVFKIEGEQLAWTKRVPKYQGNIESADIISGAPKLRDLLSYETFIAKDNVVVLFMDNIKENMQNDENSEKIKMTYGTCQMDGNLVSVTLDKEGKQKKEIVNTNALIKDKLDPELQKCFYISNDQAIISARKRTNCKMGVISIK